MQLAKYLSDKHMKATDFAETIGVKQPTVSRYLRNERFPSPDMIARIYAATGNKVTVKDWYEQAAAHRASKASSTPEQVVAA